MHISAIPTTLFAFHILYSDIPEQGKIKIIENRQLKAIDNVVNQYKHIKQLQTDSIESRGWLIDVLNCVNSIPRKDFSLIDVYKFTDELQKKHIDNHNVQAKIRQQLQLLRDKGFIEFTERGHYRKLY